MDDAVTRTMSLNEVQPCKVRRTNFPVTKKMQPQALCRQKDNELRTRRTKKEEINDRLDEGTQSMLIGGALSKQDARSEWKQSTRNRDTRQIVDISKPQSWIPQQLVR